MAQKDEEFVVTAPTGTVAKGESDNSQQDLPEVMSTLSTERYFRSRDRPCNLTQ